MKKLLKVFAAAAMLLFISSQAFADPPKKGADASLSVVEALQNSFRSISNTMLPAVVEVDVTETKTYTDPFGGMTNPFEFFFGSPRGGDDDNENKKNQREYESKDSSIPVATLGDSDKVQPGDICMAFGAPLGYSQSVTQGIVSAVGRSESHMSAISDYIQTDAAINQGNSGGPLVNIYGEVIGINTWIASSSGGSVGLGFAIPINNLKSAIDSFIKKGKVVYGWVGISLVDVTNEYKEELGVNDVDGAFAAEVFSNSPAFKGGVKPGDYIIELNGKKVKSTNQLVRDIGSLEAGATARFTVIRGGKKIPDIVVKTEERANEADINNSRMWPGFIASPLTDKAREQLKIDDKKVKGVIVTNVEEKSPAASLRIQNGDVITAVNGKKITTLAEFYDELASAQKSVNFDIYSNGGTITTGTYRF